MVDGIPFNQIILGDALKELKKLPDGCIDLIVTDPPYGYSFMGKDWDKVVIPVKYWKECLRVLKAGAFAFVMSAPRQDVLSRAICNLQDAGFQTGFTSMYWTYASGFPKASNIGKMVDKRLGVEREVVRTIKADPNKFPEGSIRRDELKENYSTTNITTPATLQAKALDGSYAGAQFKPAVEIVIVCQKPKTEKTYVDQALLWYEERQEVLREIEDELKKKYDLDSVEWENE